MSDTPRTDAVVARYWNPCCPAAVRELTAEARKMESELAAARAANEPLRERISKTDGQLSRVLHELAGSASMCWIETPKGEFDSSSALEHVAAAISELRSYLRADTAREQEQTR